MNDRLGQLASELLSTGTGTLSRHECRVLEKIAKRAHVSRNINTSYDEQQTFGERLADLVARVGGSWAFVSSFCLFLVVWATINSVLLPRAGLNFDPYPYIFLNLMLSMLAELQAPIIMMSQNRQAAKDRIAAEHDYEVNLKAEIEILSLHEKLDRLRSEHIERILERQQEQLMMLRGIARLPSIGG